MSSFLSLDPFDEEFKPNGNSDYWTYLQCSNCLKKLDNDDQTKQDIFVCHEIGCSFFGCLSCKKRLFKLKKNDIFLNKKCLICENGKKLINTTTYEEETKVMCHEKKENNSMITMMISMIPDIYASVDECHVLLIDGSQLISTSTFLETNDNLRITAINGNINEIQKMKKNQMKHKLRDQITLINMKFSEFCINLIQNIVKNKKQEQFTLFNVIYIDGCGSWGGNSHINIREDIHRSIYLLNHNRCCLAITFSQRDSIYGKCSNSSDYYQKIIIWTLSRLGRSCRPVKDKSYGKGMVLLIFDIDPMTDKQLTFQKMESFEEFKQLFT